MLNRFAILKLWIYCRKEIWLFIWSLSYPALGTFLVIAGIIMFYKEFFLDH